MKNTSDSIWKVERLSNSNIGSLSELFFNVYGSKKPVSFFQKKYAATAAGITYPGFIAFNQSGTPVASLCIIPCYLEYETRTMLAAQLTEGMTREEFRGYGLFTLLTEYIFKFSNVHGIKIIFGFPNQNARAAMLKKGWNHIADIYRFEIPVRCFPLEKFCGWLRISAFYMKYAGWLLNKYRSSEPGIANLFVKSGYGGVQRNREYMEHKKSPDKLIIKIGASKVWLKYGNDIAIGDLELNAEDFDSAIKRVKKIAGSIGVQKIFFQTSDQTLLFNMFSEKYIPRPSFPVLVAGLTSEFPPGKLKFTFADIDIF